MKIFYVFKIVIKNLSLLNKICINVFNNVIFMNNKSIFKIIHIINVFHFVIQEFFNKIQVYVQIHVLINFYK